MTGRRAALGLGAAALAAPNLAFGQATTTLRMAHIYTPGNIWFETAEAYARAVADRSGGRVRIQIAHSGSTGDWPASIEGLRIRTNDIVLQSVGTLDRYNTIAGIEAYPYLVRDVPHFRRVYYGDQGAALYEEIAGKTGFRIVGAGYRGARHLTSSRRVAALEDLRGLKLRVPPLRMYRLTWELLGASPVPMGVTELYTSLQNRVVDGQENPLEVIESNKFNEVNAFCTKTAHIIGAMTWIFAEPRWRALPAEIRDLLKTEGDRVMLEATDRMVGLESEIEARLRSRGMTFIEVDTAPWQARLGPLAREFPEMADWVGRIQAVA